MYEFTEIPYAHAAPLPQGQHLCRILQLFFAASSKFIRKLHYSSIIIIEIRVLSLLSIMSGCLIVLLLAGVYKPCILQCGDGFL